MTKGSHPTKIPETDSKKLPAFFFTFQLELPFFLNFMNLRYILKGVGNKKKDVFLLVYFSLFLFTEHVQLDPRKL